MLYFQRISFQIILIDLRGALLQYEISRYQRRLHELLVSSDWIKRFDDITRSRTDNIKYHSIWNGEAVGDCMTFITGLSFKDKVNGQRKFNVLGVVRIGYNKLDIKATKSSEIETCCHMFKEWWNNCMIKFSNSEQKRIVFLKMTLLCESFMKW